MTVILQRVGLGLLVAGLVMSLGQMVVAPPAGAIVTGMLSMWVHGTAVQIEYPERMDQIQRRAFHMRIDGKASTANWLHFPIPTPVVGTYLAGGSGAFSGLQTNYRRYHIDKVFLSFRTGSVDARVTNVHVYDAAERIAAFDNLNLYGEQHMREFTIPGAPAVSQGICVSVGVAFGANLRWIELQAVGADFFFQEE